MGANFDLCRLYNSINEFDHINLIKNYNSMRTKFQKLEQI